MSNNNQIPLFDMESRIKKYREIAQISFNKVLNTSELVLAKSNDAFALSFTKYLGVERVFGVANGTDALEIAIRALGLPVGSKVGLTANCGGYSTVAILQNSLVPIFCDVDIITSHPSIESIKQLIEHGVRAIVVTHIYGLAIQDIEEIAQICKTSDVALIEDCAQSHGAKIGDRHTGTFGDIACFSFYPTKNLGALGDGGAVITNNPEYAKRINSLRTYGWSTKYDIQVLGGRNSRLDEFQAEFLTMILPHLDEENHARRELATLYRNEIRNSRIDLPQPGGLDYVAHLFVIRSENRRDLVSHLQENLVGCGIHYPIPDHRQVAWAGRFEQISDLEKTEKLSKTVLSIPIHPYLTNSQAERVVEVLNSF